MEKGLLSCSNSGATRLVYLFDSEMTRPPGPLVWVCREGVNRDTITIFSSPSDKVNTQTLPALLKAPQ